MPGWSAALTALALARRGVSVVLLESAPQPGLAASGTNSGILHTGFDSAPGSLETELILRSAALRDPVLAALELPVWRCGALMSPRDGAERRAISELAEAARRNGVAVHEHERDGALEVPGEAVTDPVAFTLGLAAAAARHGAQRRFGFEVSAVDRSSGHLVLRDAAGSAPAGCRVMVNCAWARRGLGRPAGRR